MIKAVSHKLATSIKTAAPESPTSVEVMRYAISFLLNAALIIALSLAISLFTGKIAEAATILIAYALLRQLSGGMHLKSGWMCVFVSTIGVTILSFVNFSETLEIYISMVNVILALTYAPSRIEKQTRINPKYFPYLKVTSAVLVATGFLIHSPSMIAAFFVQCLTLISRKEVKIFEEGSRA